MTARDGAVEINGTFLGFDGEFYRVDTEFGVLTVDASGVNCEGPGCPDLSSFFAHVRFSGDHWAVDGLLSALVQSFAARSSYATKTEPLENGQRVTMLAAETDTVMAEFDLLYTSDGEGFADLASENTDIVVALREATNAEVGVAKEAGVGNLRDPVRARVLALDALTPLVSRSNPVDAISLTDLTSILTGAYQNWSDVRGGDAPISVHIRGSDFEADHGGFDLLPQRDAFAETVVVHEDVTDVIAAIEADPYAIGLGFVSAGGAVKSLGLTGSCGFFATVAPVDIKTEDYPLTFPVFLYTPARRLPALAREFIEFATSPAAQVIVARTQFVDQSVEELSFRDQGHRFANAILSAGEGVSLEDLQAVTTRFQGANRLTLGFRFEGGSTRLDAQSRSNTRLLARLLQAGVYDGKSLIFAGFSDGRGDARSNADLSKRRAESVRRAVLSAAGEEFDASRVTFSTLGAGEAMPLACDDQTWGQGLNRRVEVWVRD
ncbi:phosphate ABC transporter substrate-binding/OmpA family protein [Celeribacter sp.]|uniref:phosphate ABC transporter substrate-binding/OmpA family protein n=1 Tax=Celeribacter sp. TaxID=1890673 RepID=UPI003A8C9172